MSCLCFVVNCCAWIELKAEVEKLKLAQTGLRGIEPEKMRLFQQEIVALKMQLTQQDREMAEVHR